MSGYSKIPLATDYETKKKRLSGRQKSASPKLQSDRIVTASAVFVEQLLELCADAIENQHLRIIIKRNILEQYVAGVPGDVLLYGHRGDTWTEREPLAELEEMPFVTVQRRMKEKGWYLIEISDPEREKQGLSGKVYNNAVFQLYPRQPSNDDPYFNCEGVLWHGNNMFLLDES